MSARPSIRNKNFNQWKVIIILIFFDDFGVKNYQKVSHNMILMSKYKGQHGGKKGQQIRARPFPPPFRAMPERNRFFMGGVLLSLCAPFMQSA